MKSLMVGMLGLFVLAGCMTQVPPKVKVTDLSSGKTFTTYTSWSKENMLGYSFFDIESGHRIMLKSYTIAPLDNGGMYPPESPEAQKFSHDFQRVNAQYQNP